MRKKINNTVKSFEYSYFSWDTVFSTGLDILIGTSISYFSRPMTATAALGIGPGDLINDLNTCGLFFETMCMRDLRIFADYLDGEVRHFRTKEGLECDAVVHLKNGSYGLIEIKLGGDKLIEEGAEAVNTIADQIDTTKMKAPSFKMVLTGTSPYAYRREDGVYVVPIGCLKP